MFHIFLCNTKDLRDRKRALPSMQILQRRSIPVDRLIALQQSAAMVRRGVPEAVPASGCKRRVALDCGNRSKGSEAIVALVQRTFEESGLIPQSTVGVSTKACSCFAIRGHSLSDSQHVMHTVAFLRSVSVRDSLGQAPGWSIRRIRQRLDHLWNTPRTRIGYRPIMVSL